MTTKQNKQVALVTGGNRGIGLGVCRQLAQRGMQVILTARSEEQGRSAQQALKQEGVDVDYQVLDVTNPAQIAKVAAYVESRYRRLDVLINNAGILPDNDIPGQFNERSILDTPSTAFQDAFNTNTLGAIEVCRYFVPMMKKNKYGRIVNVSSLVAQLKTMDSGSPAYRISKVALNAVTRILADELRDYGILCNSISPGWVKTEMGGPNANVSIELAAERIIELAMLPTGGPTGAFFRDGKEIEW
jgi:NAD(P)-dependent dehydrogenase (short-subunit alcohol dehydrogenase family)